MSWNKIHLTFTTSELMFYEKRADFKKKSFSASIHDDIIKSFLGVEVYDNIQCIGKNEKISKSISIAPRQYKILVCIAKKLGILPGELVYRVIIAPHLLEIITSSRKYSATDIDNQ